MGLAEARGDLEGQEATGAEGAADRIAEAGEKRSGVHSWG
jgi:hypothetical protein